MSEFFIKVKCIKLLIAGSLLTTGATSGASAEEDLGRRSYIQVCSACHGATGNGLQIEGAEGFPPLAESSWLKGDTDRVAQILLKGLQGPIYVKGKKYDQIMPEQGALTDESAVAVINYVRTQFAGEKGGYNLNDFKKAREFSKHRKTQWTAKELLAHYPLPRPESPIKHLIMKSYSGEWSQMPDFKTLEAEAIEEEHDGYISLKKINKKANFGLVWTGDFEVTKAGVHAFQLNSDDGSRLSINGKRVAQVTGLGNMNRQVLRKVTLKPGLHKFRLDYFQKTGGQGITLNYKRPGKNKKWQWLSDEGKKAKEQVKVVIDLTPKDGRVRMYNNFIKGSSPRTMGVGYPLGNNIAFSTEHCNLDLIWKGNFISAGRHWTRRGQGFEDPASEQVVSLSQGVAWSDAAGSNPLDIQLKGIQTDKIGSPTFGYTVGAGIAVKDSFISSADKLARTMTMDSDKDQKVTFKVAESGSRLGNFISIGKLNIEFPATTIITTKGKSHFATLDLKKGNNQLKLTYSWTK